LETIRQSVVGVVKRASDLEKEVELKNSQLHLQSEKIARKALSNQLNRAQMKDAMKVKQESKAQEVERILNLATTFKDSEKKKARNVFF
jgi:hypothetical protein